jgi:hypothetical protein
MTQQSFSGAIVITGNNPDVGISKLIILGASWGVFFAQVAGDCDRSTVPICGGTAERIYCPLISMSI